MFNDRLSQRFSYVCPVQPGWGRFQVTDHFFAVFAPFLLTGCCERFLTSCEKISHPIGQRNTRPGISFLKFLTLFVFVMMRFLAVKMGANHFIRHIRLDYGRIKARNDH
jgi:hypothetical protein